MTWKKLSKVWMGSLVLVWGLGCETGELSGPDAVSSFEEDEAGSPDDLDSEDSVSSRAVGQNLTLTTVADAYIDSTASSRNFGTATALLVDNSPAIYRSFLRFTVPTLTSTVSRATLRLYVTNATADGPEVYLTTNSWSETGVTYSNQPSKQGSIIADVGSTSSGWLEIDVTKAVSAAGSLSFILLPDGSDGMDFHSREGSSKPQLVVVTGGTVTPGGSVTCTLNPYSAVSWSTWNQYKANFHTHTNNSDGSDSTSTVINQYNNANYDILAITDHNKITSWPFVPSGMLKVKGDEYSDSEHVGALFSFTNSSDDLQSGIPHIKSQGGMCNIHHPGRERGPSEWSWFVPWFRNYTCSSLEVFNQGDRYSSDRKLWDNLNENYFKSDGRLVWGTSDDDKHDTGDLYRNFQFMLMPSLSESNLRTSLKTGAFYFAYESGGSGNAKVPRISRITVDNTAKTITITASGANSISWVGPGTTSVATGSTFNFSKYTKPFVRAVLDGSSGDSYTQPFGFVAK